MTDSEPDSASLPSTQPTEPIVRQLSLAGGHQIATSIQGRPIRLIAWARHSTGSAATFDDLSLASASAYPNRVLFFAGIHGSEATTVYATARLIELIEKDLDAAIEPDTAVFIVPIANPDGYAARHRGNANGVDLNRNFPAKNWMPVDPHRIHQTTPGPSPLSEPESRALHSLVLRIKPTRILALHSIATRQWGNNYDGPARDLAELLADHNDYPVLPTIGYPTPGSFGSWAGNDLGIPTITLEFRARDSNDKAWTENRGALLSFIRGR